MKKSELVEKLKRIWQYRCDGCLVDTGGCSCAKCMKVNGSYTIKLGVPITMLGIIDFMIKSPKLLKFERGGLK
jgi:hypothetical protein